MAKFARALVDQDSKALLRIVSEVDGESEHVEANRLARAALAALTDTHPADESVAALHSIQERSSGEVLAVISGGELTAREREVAQLVASGLSNPMIAEALVVSVRTIETHVNKLIKKIGGKRRQDIRDYIIATDMQP